MICRICGNPSTLFDHAKVLEKYDIQYFHCGYCGFLQTEDPYWLDEAYDQAITKSDIGLLQRNIYFSKKTANLLQMCFDPSGKFMDYGGGYGIFVRLMRDHGYDFYLNDPMCENIFAQGFNSDQDLCYDLLTAWEVFEHLPDPIREIQNLLKSSKTLIFSTQLIPENPLPINDWWYYGTEHGQHVSFYAKKTLAYIAEKFGLQLIYSDSLIHILSDQKINSGKIWISLHDRLQVSRLLFGRKHPRSLLASDYKLLTGRELK